MTDLGELLTIEDLIARAELEPTVVDVYVEGRSDVAVLRRVFDFATVEVGVFAIDDRIGIRREDVEPFSDDYGKRAKVIAAAAAVELASPDLTNLIFVVDADWMSITGPVPAQRAMLLWTDRPSVEHYFAEGPPFDRFLSLGLGRTDLDPDDVRSSVENVIRDVAAARIALKSIDIACIETWTRLIDLNTSPPSVDYAEVFRRSLSNVPRRSRPAGWEGIADTLAEFRTMLDERQHSGRGHDIAPALIAILGLVGHFASPEVVEAMMRGSATEQDLLAHSFFSGLVERVRAAA